MYIILLLVIYTQYYTGKVAKTAAQFLLMVFFSVQLFFGESYYPPTYGLGYTISVGI